MKKTIALFVITAALVVGCSKNKPATTPSNKMDKTGAMGGATYGGTAAPTTGTPTTPPATATPNPCGAGM